MEKILWYWVWQWFLGCSSNQHKQHQKNSPTGRHQNEMSSCVKSWSWAREMLSRRSEHLPTGLMTRVWSHEPTTEGMQQCLPPVIKPPLTHRGMSVHPHVCAHPPNNTDTIFEKTLSAREKAALKMEGNSLNLFDIQKEFLQSSNNSKMTKGTGTDIFLKNVKKHNHMKGHPTSLIIEHKAGPLGAPTPYLLVAVVIIFPV